MELLLIFNHKRAAFDHLLVVITLSLLNSQLFTTLFSLVLLGSLQEAKKKTNPKQNQNQKTPTNQKNKKTNPKTNPTSKHFLN